jgi:putative nucleotidyltransferase with HDIG domain
MHTLESLLEQSGSLPTLPEIYLKVSELIESEESCSQDIGDAIQTDPSLTAKILKMINSAFYGLSSEVTSVPQAISLLGRDQLKQVLLGSILTEVFPDFDSEHFSMHQFWEHSVKTAIIARHLAMQNASVIDHEAFFTAGLLHDIGRLIIAQVAPDELGEINAAVEDGGQHIMQAEAELLGVSHIDIGAKLLRDWNMPSMLIQCLVKHHDEEHIGPFAIETSIVYLANLLSQQEPVYEEDEMVELLEQIPNWQETDCSLEQVFIACRLADEQWLDVMLSLGMAGYGAGGSGW